MEMPTLAVTKPLFRLDGGTVAYHLFYRANIDTPYAEKDIIQHTLTGAFNFTIANSFPVKLSVLGRKSNSFYFRDIYDARVEFDQSRFRSNIIDGFRQQLLNAIYNYRDPLSEKLYLLKLSQLDDLTKQIENPFTLQKLIEMNEVVRIPALTYELSLPDSIARRQSDSIRAAAKQFLEMYMQKKQELEKLRAVVDSLKEKRYETALQLRRLKNAINGQQNWASLKQLRGMVTETTNEHLSIPKKYQWLLGIRSMGLGRNQLNYSDLTTKNLSVNGFNFEYNSWYYIAVTAGLVDYRFRDFALKPLKRSPQYLYMLRMGVGQLEKNYFIVSLLRGRKQLYHVYNEGIRPVDITTMSVEMKWQLNRNSWMVAEAAQSSSPNPRLSQTSHDKFWDLSNHTNKAVSARIYWFIPQTGSRIEAAWKVLGANYQSFSSFQSNSANTMWFVKADQSFFRRQLRITASLRSNEFSDPYIMQAYKSNTVFKSFQAVFRKRNWPMMSVGYMPASQLVKIDNQIIENRFQTLNASLSHTYKIGFMRTTSTVVFNRFYNTAVDTGFAYFNAANFILSQNFYFPRFSAGLSIMNTSNSTYKLNVLDGNIQFPMANGISLASGVKLNNLNNSIVKMGYYGSAQVRLFKTNFLLASYEKGYLTGTGKNLVRNDFLTLSFSKNF